MTTMRERLWIGLLALAGTACPGDDRPAADAARAPAPAPALLPYVEVSRRDPRYFDLSDGQPYVPIGLNMIAPPGEDRWEVMEEWMRQLAAQGGNFIRIWLGHSWFDIEHRRSGEYDAEKARHIDRLLETARRHGIYVKLCIESFRHFGTRDQLWSAKPLHLQSRGGPAADIADFFDGEASRAQFKRKLGWYADRYGSDPVIFGWELWNEINAVAGGDYMSWSEAMLAELHRLFPRNLAMQSLGSFDTERVDALYRRLATMPGNDVAQVHRYLDLGAPLEACHGPVDLLAAEAVERMRSYRPGRPILLAESGAVEPRHTGPFRLYARDREGIILHDVLFAPFFCGAAGPGHIWHWDHYVSRNNLWWAFGRFAEAIRGVDPAAERFSPCRFSQGSLRLYLLAGRRTMLAWCRDADNAWQSELERGQAPERLAGRKIEWPADLGLPLQGKARIYDPWENRWTETRWNGGCLALPAFRRSLVVSIPLSSLLNEGPGSRPTGPNSGRLQSKKSVIRNRRRPA